MSLCAPPLGDGRGIEKKTTGDVGYPSIHFSGNFLQLSRIARQGLSLCMAKIAIFPEVCLYSSVFMGHLCKDCAAVGMGASPHTG